MRLEPDIGHFYPWPLVLVSCVDEAGKPNIITIGASSVCSAHPPTIGVAIGVRQYSLGLISGTQDFGVNIPTAEQLWQSDYCGSVSGRNMEKYEAAGFTPQASALIKSPLIEECPMSMECKLIHTAHLGDHDWLIGEIVAVHADEGVLTSSQRLDCSKTNPVFSFWGEYWSVGERLAGWHYALREKKEDT
ncbi:MAG: flavin reductase family protein [Candidatus Brocadiaceae bacterium]|jgi:flavin reductase (DIM6/NTAB) family NADH-FMN oxidoreductase RutF